MKQWQDLILAVQASTGLEVQLQHLTHAVLHCLICVLCYYQRV